MGEVAAFIALVVRFGGAVWSVFASVEAAWVTAIATAVLALIAALAMFIISAWYVSSVLFGKFKFLRVRPLTAIYRHILQFRHWNREVESQHYREPLDRIASHLETIAKRMPTACATKDCPNLSFALSLRCPDCIKKGVAEGTESREDGL